VTGLLQEETRLSACAQRTGKGETEIRAAMTIGARVGVTGRGAARLWMKDQKLNKVAVWTYARGRDGTGIDAG
jgi:hypothetical protein